MAIAFRAGEGTRGGVLLVHGFTGTPHEMQGLADPLASAGYQVLGVRLPGHGDAPPDEPNDWQAWDRAVEEAFAELHDLAPGAPKAVIGLSMGALLGLELARRRPGEVSSLVALSPAVTLPTTLRAVLWLADRTFPPRVRDRRIPKRESDIRDPVVRATHPKSAPFRVASVLSFNQLRVTVRRQVGAVTQPLLIVHSRLDRTCPVSGAHWLARRVGSRDVELVVLERCGHVIPVDLERDRATEAILSFLGRTLHGAPQRERPIEEIQQAVREAGG
ncbi:MAG TPA: alpha/beta fold hydrolase [Candidatus Binatia bacterium]